MTWTDDEKLALIALARTGMAWQHIGNLLRPGVPTRSHCCSNAFRRFGSAEDKRVRRAEMKRCGQYYPKGTKRPHRKLRAPVKETFSGNCFAV